MCRGAFVFGSARSLTLRVDYMHCLFVTFDLGHVIGLMGVAARLIVLAEFVLVIFENVRRSLQRDIAQMHWI